MGRGEYLGEFEQVVLLAVLSLGADAYGIEIRSFIEDVGDRSVTVPTVYSVLQRLEDKGLVASRLGDATPERGGRAKRYYRLLPEGRAALRRSRELLDRMWDSARASGAKGI